MKRQKIYFLNLGYYDDKVNENDWYEKFKKVITNETSKRQAALYLKLFRLIDFKPVTCLEVASGLGGGSYLAKKYFKPDSVLGIDINSFAINYAKKELAETDLHYREMSYRHIGRLKQKFDLIFSLEASFHFEDLDAFFSTCRQSLEKDGVLLYGDLVVAESVPQLKEIIKKSGFQITAVTDVSTYVLRSIDQLTPVSGLLRIMETLMLKPFNLDFVKGSFYYKKLQNQEIAYLLFALRKS